MEDTYKDLASRIITLAKSHAPGRILVGVAGPPGAGKTTVVDNVVRLIAGTSSKLLAVGVSLDGFHYSRAQLDAFPDPIDAHRRRGAPWTFDVGAINDFIKLLEDSKAPSSPLRQDIYAPTFDHAIKDPIAGGCLISAAADIVLIDSNYILFDEDDWRDISKSLDFRVFINIDPSVARTRVAKRHVSSGIEQTLELGQARFDSNDSLNGEMIRHSLLPHDFEIQSV